MSTYKRNKIASLSGRGSEIFVEQHDSNMRVFWGKSKFGLSNDMLTKILSDFFKDTEIWYPLGASFSNPMKDGLGRFIKDEFNSLTPRHASAIAAILVHEKLVEYKGIKPIELRKL